MQFTTVQELRVRVENLENELGLSLRFQHPQ